jgi:aryl-alcohol dehydrogenase-like predicted oxidoreductase
MKSVLLGTSGLRVSEICLGTGLFGQTGWGADEATSRRVFDAYLDAGGNFLDCANTYAAGHSEELLGSFAWDKRDALVIATKFTAMTREGDVNSWGNHRKSLRQALDASLRRLRTDYIDLLWVHAWDELTPFDEQMRALDDAVRAGKVLHIGSSNTPAWGVAHANGIANARHQTPFCAIQNQYSLLERTAENELIPMARHLGLAVLAWSPLAAGVLAGGYAPDAAAPGLRHADNGVSPAHVDAARRLHAIAAEAGLDPVPLAYAWVCRRDVIPVIGARTLGHLDSALAALELDVPADVMRELDAIAPPAPVMPQEFLRSDDGIEFFHRGVRDRVRQPSG